MIRLLAIDVDGTLLDSRGRLPDVHRDALVEASALGVEVALVTGRNFHFTGPVVDLLPIPLTLIVNNGAVVKRKDGATVLRQVLSRETARRILDQTRHLEDSVALVFDRTDERQNVFERKVGREKLFLHQKFYELLTTDGAEIMTYPPLNMFSNRGLLFEPPAPPNA